MIYFFPWINIVFPNSLFHAKYKGWQGACDASSDTYMSLCRVGTYNMYTAMISYCHTERTLIYLYHIKIECNYNKNPMKTSASSDSFRSDQNVCFFLYVDVNLNSSHFHKCFESKIIPHHMTFRYYKV